MIFKYHFAISALLGLSLMLSAPVQAEPNQSKLASQALAAQFAGLASPTIAIGTPEPEQPYTVGEKATVTWYYTGISKKKKLRVSLLQANGKSIRSVRVRADRAYRFTLNQKLARKLSQVEVCIPRSTKFPGICDLRKVTVLEAPPPGAAIGFNPPSVGFVAQKDVDPPAQVLEISTTESQNIGYSVANDASWLSVSPGDGTAPGSVTLTAHTAGLVPGTYKTSLKVTAAGTSSSTSVPVTLEILKPGTKTPLGLKFSATTLGFDLSSGAAPESRQLDIFTSTSGTVAFQAASNASWLSVTPNTGTTPASLTVSASATGLSPGSYSGEIRATADGHAAVKLGVTLNVTAPPTPPTPAIPALQSSTASLSFTAASGTSPAVQNIQLSTNTGAAVSFALDEPAPWLSVLPVGTSTPSGISLAANGAGLLPGDYSTTLKAQSSGYQSVAIPVRFKVTAPTGTDLLSDDFNDGSAAEWSIGNETKNTPDWQVVNGQFKLVNLVALASDTHKQGHNVGTYAIRNDSIPLQDYQFDVTATSSSEFNVDTGVMFRYQDPNNYYRLSIGNGMTRLERKRLGTFSTLAGNARGYLRGVPQVISVSVQGALIQVSVNGERLFTVRDAEIATGGVALYCRDNCAFDDVHVRPVPGAPSIAVSKPEAHTVVAQTNFDVSAVVLNDPGASAEVEFSLTDMPGACGQAVSSGAGLFTAQCSIPADGVIRGVTASLKVGGTLVDLDSNERIAYGNKIVAVGDSITFGVGDDNSGDNPDPGGWVVSDGYAPVLTKLLNQSHALPSMVYNNGIPGGLSVDIKTHIGKILERHADAQYVLLMIGTNDAGRDKSVAEYGANLDAAIATITSRGKTPIVARIPPRLGDDPTAYPAPIESAPRNQKVISYNDLIESRAVSGLSLGPDFFNYFLARQDQFSDLLHPNGLGYNSMGEQWSQSLGFLP